MSILNNVTSFFQPKPHPIPREECKPAKPDCGDDKESRWNDDYKGREHWKNGDKDEYSKHGKDDSKHAKNDGDHKGRDHWKDGDKDDSKHGKDDYSKHAKNDGDHKGRDHWKDGDKDGDSKHGDKDGYSKHAKNDDCSDDGRKEGDWKHHGKDDYKDGKDGKGDHSKHDGGWKDAKNDDCRPHKDDCQPQCQPKDPCQSQKDYCAPRPSDDCGKGDTSHSPGDALARFDFSRGDFGSRGPDHSGDIQGALASMSSDHALDYAIGQMGPADQFDIGQDDVTSHDTVQHA